MPNPKEEGVTLPGLFTCEVNPAGVDVQLKLIGLLKVMLQLFINPESGRALSEAYNCHVPFGSSPLKIPNAADAVDAVSGLKVPVKGAEAELMFVAEPELNTVFVKLSPAPPLQIGRAHV